MKKYHHCVKFTYPLSFQTRIPKEHVKTKLVMIHIFFVKQTQAELY